MSHRDCDSKTYQPNNPKSSTFSSSTTTVADAPKAAHHEDMPSRVASLPSYFSHRRGNSDTANSIHKAPAQTSVTHVETTPVPPNSHRRSFFSSFSHSRSRSRSSRSKSPKRVPDPLDTGLEKEAFLYHSGQRTNSPPPLSPDMMSPVSLAETSASASTSKKKRHSSSYSVRKSSSDGKRLSGTVHHRGRHANDWLFGGFSVRDQVGKLWKDDNDDERDNK